MAQDWDLPDASDSLSASRELLTNALEALLSCFSGTTAPDASIRVPGMLWFKSDSDQLFLRDAADANWVDLTAAASGEANTASNGGAGGVGVFDSKSGVDLIFRNIIAGDGTITVTLDAGNKEIEIKVPVGGITSSELADQSVGLAEMVHVPQFSILLRTAAGTGIWQTVVVGADTASMLQAADYAAIRALLNLVIGTNVQAWSADLDTLVNEWVAASSAGPASLNFAEDTDNGAHRIRVIAPAALSGDFDLTLPAATDTLAVLAAAQTFTNKRITARVQSVTGAATVTPDADADDMVKITAQDQALTLANPTGTPTEGQKLVVRIKDNLTARAISFGSKYRALGNTLPTLTTLGKTLYLGLIYNATDDKWDLVAKTEQA